MQNEYIHNWEFGEEQDVKESWSGSPGGSSMRTPRQEKPLRSFGGRIIDAASQMMGPSGNPQQATPRNFHTVASMGGGGARTQMPMRLHKGEGEYPMDDESDYYMEDDEDKWVIMPTEELFDDGSEDEETNSEKKVHDDEIPLPSWLRKPRSRPTIRFGQTGSAGGGSGIGAGRVRPTIRFGGGAGGRGGVRANPLTLKSANQPLRDPEGGLTAAGRRHFKETEGANLKPGVKGPADTPTKMRRKGSFLVRFFTNPSGPMVDEKGRPTRLALSARAWGEPVPKNRQDAAKLAAKGRRLLDRYRAQQEKSKGQKSFEQFQLSFKELGAPVGSSSGTVGGRSSQRSSGGADRFNPNARDADGDGSVQEGTDFMRQTDTKPKKWMTDRGSADTRERGAVRQNLTDMGFDGEAFKKFMDAEARKLKPGQKTNWNPGRLPNGGKIAADGTYIPPDMVREDDKRMSDYYRKRREARAKASRPKMTREGDVVPNKNKDRRKIDPKKLNSRPQTPQTQGRKPQNSAKPFSQAKPNPFNRKPSMPWDNVKPFNQGKPNPFGGEPRMPWGDGGSKR